MKALERFTIIIAALGIAVPILWDRYRGRTALELQILSISTLVQQNQGIEKLQITYDTMVVPSVSRIELALVNTGRTAIIRSQIVEPPTITLQDGQLLDVRISRTTPPGISAALSVDPKHHSISLAPPLLNGGDAVFLSLLTSSSRPQLRASARVAGVREVALRDRTEPFREKGRRRLSWSFYVVAAFTTFVLFIFLVGIHIIGGEAALRAVAENHVIRLPTGYTPGALRNLVTASFHAFAAPETLPVKLDLAIDPEGVPLSDDRTQEIERKLIDALVRMKAGRAVTAVFGILLCLGLWFVISRLL